MPIQHTRLRDDLRGLIKGDVRCDEVTQQLYATDAGMLQFRPVCIVCPRSIEDVIAVVRYAAEQGIPIHPRGAGTSLTGESLGEGIVIVFSRYMRRILNVGDDTVTVQPGLLRRRLNGIIGKSQQRLFGPLAGSPSSTTLGSILARNGAGLHYLRYGLPSDHLVSMTVVLANGDLLTLDRQTLPQPLQGDGSGVVLAQEIAYGKEYVYAGRVAQLLTGRTSEQLVESAHQVAVNRAGYAERDVLSVSPLSPLGERVRVRGKYNEKAFSPHPNPPPKGEGTEKYVDLARLFTGSEGTLGLTVEATLKTVSQPQRSIAAAFFFNSLSQAIEAVSVILSLRPVLCELIDRRRLNMVRDWDARYHNHIPAEAEAALLVELDAGTLDEPTTALECRHNLKHLIDLVQSEEKLSFHALKVTTEEDFQLFDEVIRRSELVLGRMRHSIQSLPLFDDVAVPPGAVSDVINDLLPLLHRYKVTASLSGHVGQGHLRIHPLLDLAQSDTMSLLRPLADEVYAMILRHGGTISSEWGTGLLKSSFVPQQFPYLTPLFREIKETFDPQHLLNPGRVISPETHWTANLRHGLEKRGHTPPNPMWSSGSRYAKQKPLGESSPTQVEVQLRWEPSYVFESAYQCNGCGECYRSDRQSRICPLSRGTATIEYTPRAKADLLRGILEHDIDLEKITGERAKEIADTCFQCRMCDIDCPSKVDVNVLSFRSKSAYVAAHGLPLVDLMASRLDMLLRLFTPSSFLFNAAMRNRLVRWFLEKTLRIPQRRVVPVLASRPYLHRVRWSHWRQRLSSEQTHQPRVALFVDTFANHFDPQLAELAVQILEHNGFSVHVPPRQRPSGLPSFSVGHADRAERLARQNVAQLSELIRLGYKIVTLEPHAASCLTKDYRHLVDDKDSDLMAENVVDFCTLLYQYHQADKLQREFRPLPYRAGYHAPCRGLATSVSMTSDTMPAEKLLRLIPGLEVHRIERGCCGMGGLWGFQQKNYRHSLQIGIPLFRALRQPEIDFGVSDCNACCLQMEYGTKKSAVHPIRLLAVAYGFLPVGLSFPKKIFSHFVLKR
jgi:FAD/FMN-containing dehydrogenase/Fe-S oxidoreductase